MIKRDKSREIFNSAKSFITGGVHSGFRYRTPHPIYFSRGKGSKVWDIDGNEYIDCLLNMGACILGHNFEKVNEAVKKQLNRGLTVGLETDLSIEVAKRLSKMIPSAEIVKISNTGTEAVMHAIQIARGYTKRNKIIKLEGGYNGWYDYVLVSSHPRLEDAGPKESPNTVPDSGGLAREVVKNTLVIPFNDIDAAERIISKNSDEVAALVMEPIMFNVGCVCPKQGYLKAIRDLTEDHEIVLVFDEVISGFRMAPGGAQQYYNVTPDITTLGKAIANGFPLSAVVGREEFMDVTDPESGSVAFAGTYNANQISMAASKATLEELSDGRVQRRLHQLSERLKQEFEAEAEALGLQARLQGTAGKFQVYFTNQDVIDYRSAVACDKKKYLTFQGKVFESGVLMWPSYMLHHGLSAAHTDQDMNFILYNLVAGLKEVKKNN
ncbi:MAG: aminotransferase class III-fold pyridoxal phosphate-dependent enzyme [Nitrososphaeria archaeon]|nr:aminotransferase class III-fold pyridoxal phosphate-dependent enzyme [Nitrososphaeria archaeon]NIN52252.1 aminotransferase class III-fold pyridoxal phosphate-dependent enzyme [Nitrososphaeria archaeon]NIQ32708.1 aminotransferase class III-fold pyridoxal phosphate-dependent enzyme [Nitrososphaeria archaeon]